VAEGGIASAWPDAGSSFPFQRAGIEKNRSAKNEKKMEPSFYSANVFVCLAFFVGASGR